MFDTSVLIPSLVESLPEHARAAVEVRHAVAKDPKASVAAHALAELYAVLTTLPVSPRITPGQARKLIRHNVASRMDVVALDGADYQAVIEQVTNLGLPGGIVYDALHLRAAEKAGVDRLVTFNRRDFERLAVETRVELVFL